MGTVSKRKSKINYRDICQPKDIIQKATTVRTFNKETWVNCWNGYFARYNVKTNKLDQVVAVHTIYATIQTVADKEIVIARKDNPKQPLRFLETPYVIGKRR